MRVLVTGAGGYLGRAVTEHLVAGQHRVRAMVRKVGPSLPTGTDVVSADLAGDEGPVARALEEIEAVVHCAAHMGGGDRDVFRRTTVQGTERLLRLAAERGVRRFVHVSSIAVYGWKRPGATVAPADAFDVYAPLRDHYAWSKIEAERWVRLYGRMGLLEVVVVRPGIIYDRRRRFFARLARRLVGPLHAIAGSPSARVPLVHLGDVVEAIGRALVAPRAAGAVVNAVGPELPTQRRYLAVRHDGETARTVPLFVPLAPLRWLGTRLARRCRFGGASGKSLVYELRWLDQNVAFDLRQGAEMLGWMPRIGLAEGQRS